MGQQNVRRSLSPAEVLSIYTVTKGFVNVMAYDLISHDTVSGTRPQSPLDGNSQQGTYAQATELHTTCSLIKVASLTSCLISLIGTVNLYHGHQLQ